MIGLWNKHRAEVIAFILMVGLIVYILLKR
jgi:hypothetical protein